MFTLLRFTPKNKYNYFYSYLACITMFFRFRPGRSPRKIPLYKTDDPCKDPSLLIINRGAFRVRFGDPDHDRVLRTETWSGAKTTWSS